MGKQALVLLMTLLMFSGCSHVISEESRKLVDVQLTFGKLKEDPDAYSGKHVMLGGIIAGVRNAKTGGELEVVQFNLDHSDMPENIYNSGGRFLVTTPGFLAVPFVLRRAPVITTMPSRLARYFAEAFGLATSAAPIELPGFTISLLWHASFDQDPGHLWLRQTVSARGGSRRSRDHWRYRCLPAPRRKGLPIHDALPCGLYR